MHGGVCGCPEVHGDVQRCTEVCAEVCVGGTEVCIGAQKVTEVHRYMWRCMAGHRGAWRGVWRCKEVDRGVIGGGQSVQRYTEDCIEACRGM